MALSPMTTLPQAKAEINTTFSAIHFPTAMTFAGFTDPSGDYGFLLMLKETGVSTISIITDPVIFQAYKPRYEQLISDARSLGFKIHLINQMDWKYRLKLIGLKNPLQTIIPLSFSKILAWETSWMQLYASYHPDFLSVLAEPSNLNFKMRKGLTESQVNTLIGSLASTVKQISPETQTWVDLQPQYGIVDYYVGKSAAFIPNLDGIGWDVYDRDGYAVLAEVMPFAVQAGKLTGITETWRWPLYAKPQYDLPSNAPVEAGWFKELYNQTLAWGVTPSLFNPFFTNKFVLLDPMPTELTAPAIRDYADSLKLAVDLNNRTVIFSAYQLLVTGA